MDRISQFSDDLLLQILSFLPIHDVFSTNQLSTRWRNLWRKLRCLNFTDGQLESLPHTEVRNSIDRTLMLWNGFNIEKFVIHLRLHSSSCHTDLDRWMLFAKLNGVQDLHVALEYLEGNDELYPVPACVHLCSSLKRLCLLGCNYEANVDVHWITLKSLSLDGYFSKSPPMEQILLGCPKLEELTLSIRNTYRYLKIKSLSLKMIVITESVHGVLLNALIGISCPNLLGLHLLGDLYERHFLDEIPCLTDLKIGFTNAQDFVAEMAFKPTLSDLYSSIAQVRRLTLSSWTVNRFQGTVKQYFASPWTIERLAIEGEDVDLEGLLIALHSFQDMERLIISCGLRSLTSDFVLFKESDVPTLRNLKKVYITCKFSKSVPFLELAKIILSHSPVLESMVICPIDFPPGTWHTYLQRLMSLPLSSLTGRISIKR